VTGTDAPAAATAPTAPAAELVADAAALATAARSWPERGALALDTEFVRERTFFPRLGLVQVSDGATVTLIDPLAVGDVGDAGDLAPLLDALRAPGPVKVLHSASEDLEVFYRAFGIVPEPLFDTQIAAALAGVGAALGYQKLVSTLLGVELHKGETRTDWLARPLTPAQLAYAAEDVAYLPVLYARLGEELARLGRLDWVREDSAALVAGLARLDEDPQQAYRRRRGAGRLGRRQLAALRALAAWREGEARRRDLPRSFVLREDLLLSLATRRPATPRELARLPAFDARQAARDGALWLELIRQAEALPEEELPPELPRLPVTPAFRQLETDLRALVARRAADLGLPNEVLASRRTLDALLKSAVLDPEPRLPRELAGWRRAVVGDDLLAAVRAADLG
jgi:ribonuclease D